MTRPRMKDEGRRSKDMSAESAVPPTALEDWLDTPTVEDMLNISRRTLQAYRSQRVFPFLKIGNKLYYKRADIERYLEQRYAEQNTPCAKGGNDA